MKKLIALVLIFMSLSPRALADNCDWTKIIDNKNGTYTYPLVCHLAVGKMVEQFPLMQQQILDLTKTITLDQLALKDSQSRGDMWEASTLKLTDTLNKYESLKTENNLLYFGLGIAVVIASAWVVGQTK